MKSVRGWWSSVVVEGSQGKHTVSFRFGSRLRSLEHRIDVACGASRFGNSCQSKWPVLPAKWPVLPAK